MPADPPDRRLPDRGHRRITPVAVLAGTSELALLTAAWFLNPVSRRILTMLTTLAVVPLIHALLTRRSPRQIATTTGRALGLTRRPDLRTTATALLTVIVISALAPQLWQAFGGHIDAPVESVQRPPSAAMAAGAVLLYPVLLFGVCERIFVIGLARRLESITARRTTAGTVSWPALIAATLVWTAGHTGSAAYWLTVAFLIGLILAWAYHSTGSLWTAIIVHASWDTAVLLGLDTRILAIALAPPLILIPRDTPEPTTAPAHRSRS